MHLASQAGPAMRHGAGALIRGSIVAAIVAALLFALAPAFGGGADALAAKGGGKPSTSTVRLVLFDSDDDVANHGERLTFYVSTTATDRPFVGLRCWQGSTWIYDGYVGFFPTYMFDPWLTLDSPYWTDDVGADCTARLFYYDKRGNQKVLATTSFWAAP